MGILILYLTKIALCQKRKSLMGNSVQVTKEKLVPCCNCQAWIDGMTNVNCSYYFGIILSEEKGLKMHCQHPNMKKQGEYEEVKQ